jgi:hypothetical protein
MRTGAKVKVNDGALPRRFSGKGGDVVMVNRTDGECLVDFGQTGTAWFLEEELTPVRARRKVAPK